MPVRPLNAFANGSRARLDHYLNTARGVRFYSLRGYNVNAAGQRVPQYLIGLRVSTRGLDTMVYRRGAGGGRTRGQIGAFAPTPCDWRLPLVEDAGGSLFFADEIVVEY